MDSSTCKILRTSADTIALLSDTVAFANHGHSIFHHGQKHPSPSAFSDGETVFAPSDALAGALGRQDVPVDRKQGAIGYCDVKAFCEKNGIRMSRDDRGFTVLGDISLPEDKKALWAINNYLLYDRPDADIIRALFDSRNKNTHPRVLMNAKDKAAMLERFRTNATVKAWGEAIIARAEQTLLSPDPEYIIPDGKRLLATSRQVYDYAKTLATAYVLTGDERFAKNLYGKMMAAARFPDWNPSHFLDVGEMTTALAIGYDWCFDAYSEAERDALADAIFRHGVNVGRACYYNEMPAWWTPGNTTNWNVVCNGGLAVGAVAIFDRHPEICADVISIALRDVEAMMNSFYPDGAWFEGVGYWSYTMSYLLNMITTLDACFGTDFNISEAPALDKTAYYVIGGDGATGINNFHDAGGGHTNHPALFWLSNRYGIPGLTNVRLFKMKEYGDAPGVFDLLWYDTAISGTQFELSPDIYMRDVEFVSMRGSWVDRDTAFLSYHAGSNHVNHGHLDSGTFVFDLSGERWALDLSGDDYNLPFYFGSERFNYYRLRTEGHNVFVINPRAEDAQEVMSFCPILTFESKKRGAISTVDLTPAYHKDAESAVRGFLLGDDRRSMTVRDEIVFKNPGSEIFWFMHTAADVEILDPHTAILQKNGKRVLVKVATDLPDYELTVMAARPLPTSPDHPDQNKNEGFRKLTIHASRSEKQCYIQVKLIGADDPNAALPMDVSAIADQSVPD